MVQHVVHLVHFIYTKRDRQERGKPRLRTFDDLRATLAEFFSTGLLVFFGSGTLVVTGTMGVGELTVADY